MPFDKAQCGDEIESPGLTRVGDALAITCAAHSIELQRLIYRAADSLHIIRVDWRQGLQLCISTLSSSILHAACGCIYPHVQQK